MSKVQEGGDIPLISIEPAESFNDEKLLVKHEESRPGQSSHFVLHEVIGKGGFSTVRRASHTDTTQTYAIKILDKSCIKVCFMHIACFL